MGFMCINVIIVKLMIFSTWSSKNPVSDDLEILKNNIFLIFSSNYLNFDDLEVHVFHRTWDILTQLTILLVFHIMIKSKNGLI